MVKGQKEKLTREKRSPNQIASAKGKKRPKEENEGVRKKRKEDRLRLKKGRKKESEVEAEERSESECKSSFTAEAIEGLIESARRKASEQEGREGPAEAPTSQSCHSRIRSAILGWEQSAGQQATIAQLQEVVCDVLEILHQDEKRSRFLPTAGKRTLFPLPVPGLTEDFKNSPAVLQALARSLNSLNGVGIGPAVNSNACAVRAMKRVDEALVGSPILNEKLPFEGFQEFFRTKNVDYQGEEVRLAKPLVWRALEPSLPNEVGKLDLRDFCTGGILDYIDRFEEFLLPPNEQILGKPPKVMVTDEEWKVVAKGLLEKGLCQAIPLSQVYHVQDSPLLNGMFAVGKQEYIGNVETCRLIMNLKPTNTICKSLTADTGTLPSINHLGSLVLDPDSVLVTSSEDIKCFFYLFRIPEAWKRFLVFAKQLPVELCPLELRSEPAFLAATVLPMGWLNSVGIAQHVHRNVVRQCMNKLPNQLGGECELRRDKVFSSSPNLFRIYLDNFDALSKVDRKTARMIEGEVSDEVVALRKAYEEVGLPRHPKKSVQQQVRAEVQGALIDGEKGIMCAKPSKVARYVRLALELIKRGSATQKELQVVGGGMVYVCMFKRPLMSALNLIWQKIISLEGSQAPRGEALGNGLLLELTRFLGLVPLAYSSFRSPFDEHVTASDASTTGGGATVSRGLTPYGSSASQGLVRGDVKEQHDFCQILCIGLFDGISGLRVSLDALGAPVAGHISVEKQPEARRVVESFFPDTVFVEDVELIDEQMVEHWALLFSVVGLVLIGAGPPCQGVSGLNSDRRGALRDHRSKLFSHVQRIKNLCKVKFRWAQVRSLAENVASMDASDCQVMNESYEEEPWLVNAGDVCLAARPRIYWVDWELMPADGVLLSLQPEHHLPLRGEAKLTGIIDQKKFLEPGWQVPDKRVLPTFTTSRPSQTPLRRPAGLSSCRAHERQRWEADLHRFPPYQYKDENTLFNKRRDHRVPSIAEREAILGFPVGYTRQCMSKSNHGSDQHRDCRLTLLGNSWSIPIVAWLLSNLLIVLGLIKPVSLQDILNKLTPGSDDWLPGLLLRPPLDASTKTLPPSSTLVQKICGLTSLTGEDVLLQSHTDVPVKFHRLRQSLPAKLWRWKVVAGWVWQGSEEHINVLELRSVLTTIRWRIERLGQQNLRCLHLVDSLVVLHALTRGRSSSRKLRRTLMRISSYLLLSGLQPLWGYVDTSQNPADKPSRRGVKKRWVKK